MYVAVIAEKVADRRHLERLLDRVSDNIMETAGNLYIESFGDAMALKSVAHKYNMFFLDFETDRELMGKIVDTLLEASVSLDRIIICQSKEVALNYQKPDSENSPAPFTVQKPLRIEQLTEVVLKIHQMEMDAKVPTLEIRTDNHTQYVPVASIVYAEEEDYQVHIHLSNDEDLFMIGKIEDFARNVEFCGDFITYKKGFSYNRDFEKSKSPTRIVLTTGKTFTLSRFDRKLPF